MNAWKGIAIAAIWLGLFAGVAAIAGLAGDANNAASLGIFGGLIAAFTTIMIVIARN